MSRILPDDISDILSNDAESDRAKYDQDASHGDGFSLSTAGLPPEEGQKPSGGSGAEDDALRLDESGAFVISAELVAKPTIGASLTDLLKDRNVFLVRHGNAVKGTELDADRTLSPKAEHQCASFLASYGSMIDKVKYAFVSPTKRTKSTAGFLGFPDPTCVEYLYFESYFSDDLKKLEGELGYAPLGKYLDAKEGLGEQLHAPVREKMAADLAAVLGKELEKATALGEYEGDILIVSHAITVSLCAQAVLRAIKAGLDDDAKSSADEMCPEEDKILSFNVGEVEGFAITSKGEVTLLQNESE
jgi:broad specificity phosphatase PhoE